MRRDNALRYSLIIRWIFLFHSGTRGIECLRRKKCTLTNNEVMDGLHLIKRGKI